MFFVNQVFYDISSYNKYMTIGECIKSLRKENQLTQQQLADKLFISQDTISLWERNKSTPDAKAIVELCKIFDVSADYLLDIKK